MGIKLDPACRHLVPCAAAAAAKKAAPNIDHPGIVFRGQAIRRGGPMPLLGKLVSKLRRLWKS
jgi:hypothetical protein